MFGIRILLIIMELKHENDAKILVLFWTELKKQKIFLIQLHKIPKLSR